MGSNRNSIEIGQSVKWTEHAPGWHYGTIQSVSDTDAIVIGDDIELGITVSRVVPINRIRTDN